MNDVDKTKEQLIDELGRSEDERRQAVEALNESAERFKDFFDNAPIGFHIFRHDGIIIDINNAELEMFGFSREVYCFRPF